MIWVDAKESPSTGASSLLIRPLLLPPKLTAPAASPTAADTHAAVANAVDKAAVPDTSAAVPAAATAAVSAAYLAAVSAAAAASQADAALSSAHTSTLGDTDISPHVDNASQHNSLDVQAAAGNAAASPPPDTAADAVHQAPSTSSRESILPFQAQVLPISNIPKGRDGSSLPFNAPLTLPTTAAATGRLDQPQGARQGQLPEASASSNAPFTCHTQQAQQAKRAQQAQQSMQLEQARQARQAWQAEQAQQVDQVPRVTARAHQQAILESSRHLIGVLGSDSPISNEPSGDSLTEAQLDSQTIAAAVPASQQRKRKAVHAAG